MELFQMVEIMFQLLDLPMNYSDKGDADQYNQAESKDSQVLL